jgi:hypothetical protein
MTTGSSRAGMTTGSSRAARGAATGGAEGISIATGSEAAGSELVCGAGGIGSLASGVAEPGVGMLADFESAALVTVPSRARRKVFPHFPQRIASPLGPTRASSTR